MIKKIGIKNETFPNTSNKDDETKEPKNLDILII